MSKLNPKIPENGIDYIPVGDCFILHMMLSEEHRSIGKYGRMRRMFLQEYKRMLIDNLMLTKLIYI